MPDPTPLLNAPILFFALGIAATAVRSTLEIPAPLPKLFSLYLLMAIGLKGGISLREGGLSPQTVWVLLAGVALSAGLAALAYGVFRRAVKAPDAGALAAAYGSVSAVTYITAASFLDAQGVPYSGHMAAVLAVMEAPAILIGVLLARKGAAELRHLLHEAVFNGSIFLLLGGIVIGALVNGSGAAALKPFTTDFFTGMLCFFLLEMGMTCGRSMRTLRALGPGLPLLALAISLTGAGLAFGVARALDLSRGDSFLLMILSASASYIAVPAAMRTALPDADPAVYVTLPLAVTFPFNVLVGMAVYLAVL